MYHNVKKALIVTALALSCFSWHAEAQMKFSKTMVPSSSINNLSDVLTTLQKNSALPVVFPFMVPKPTKGNEYYAYLEPGLASNRNHYQIDIDNSAECHGVKICNIGSLNVVKDGQPSIQTDMNKKQITVQVQLANNQIGYFTPSHAMADYWPAMIQWNYHGVLYTVSWNATKKLEKSQLVQMANSVLIHT